MCSDRLDELIAQLETITSKYGHFASKLSDSITTIERRLASLEGKMACQTESGEVTLSFGRERDKWTLKVVDRSAPEPGTIPLNPVGCPLRTAPVAVKIRAVGLIEPLLKQMLTRQRVQLIALRQAAMIGSDIAKSLNSNPKEGEK